MGKNALHAKILHVTGLVASGMGYSELACRIFDTALVANPENPKFHYERGAACKNRHWLDEAEISFRRALELKPDMAAAYGGLGDVLRARNKADDAIIQYEKALSLDPDCAHAHFGLGVILKERHRLADAARHFRRVVELVPGDFEAAEKLDDIISLQKQLKAMVDDGIEKIRAGTATPQDLENFTSALYDAATVDMHDWAVSRAAEWVQRMPQDPLAVYTLKGLKGDASPHAAPEGYVEELFDRAADKIDERLRKLSYRVPDIAAVMIAGNSPVYGVDILDAGCGTGLCAPALKPYARTLTGVDISARMLEGAKKKGMYDQLQKSDIVSYLHARSGAFDLIAAMDVLCYFGDLTAVITAMAGSLRADGRVVFTVEHDKSVSQAGWRLLPSGRFCHTEKYVREKLGQAGLAPVAVDPELLRQEMGQNVEGLAVLARKES